MQTNNTISSTITENYIRYFINSCGEDYRKDGDWWHSSKCQHKINVVKYALELDWRSA